jgi:hypothetical protein
MTHRYAHLTNDPHCLAALDATLAEKPALRGTLAGGFAAGFITGWQERRTDEHHRGMTVVNSEYLAALELAAQQREAER